MRTKKLSNLINSIQCPKDIERQYIGASSIGLSCDRALWYGLKGTPKANTHPQRQRTFNVGKRLEGLLLDELEYAGLELLRPSTKNQFLLFQEPSLPQFQGHCDAIWEGEGIIEIKTARDASFRIFANKGLRAWYPVYYAQIQAYMGMSGYDKGYLLAINKDTSEIHDEEVSFDNRYYDSLVEKAASIVESVQEPDRINDSPLYFMCAGCDYRGVCHG